MSPYASLGRILEVAPDALERLDRAMGERTGRIGVMAHVASENEAAIRRTLQSLGMETEVPRAPDIKTALRTAAARDERALLKLLDAEAGANEFEKAASLARKVARVGKGFFLKKSYGADILRKSRPDSLLKFLGLADVDALLAKHDVTEIFSALRFIETDEWMHGTFETAYSGFTAADFEERDIEIKVLGSEWQEVAKQFVAKKHHNVSHLKEFGVIFLNPIREDAPGKYLRDFALLFHYFHEIEFYSKLFRHYADRPVRPGSPRLDSGQAPQADFATHLKSLLRGDVRQTDAVKEGEWLIIQRYLWKEKPDDPRLALPHMNPESVHWFRGERDLAAFGAADLAIDWEMWGGLDWAGNYFPGDGDLVVSFDLEDNAMSAVAFLEGKHEYLNYHQREALWTKLFLEYAGGEEEMERLLVENFDKGSIIFENQLSG